MDYGINIKSDMSKLISDLTESVKKMTQLSNTTEKSATAIKNLGQMNLAALKASVSGVHTVFNRLFNLLKSGIAGVNKLSHAAFSILQSIGHITLAGLRGALTAVHSALSFVGRTAKSAFSLIKSGATAAMVALKNITVRGINGAIVGFQKLGSVGVNILKNIAGHALNAVKNVGKIATAAATAGTALTLKEGVKYGEYAEKTLATYTNSLGSAMAAQKRFAEMQKFTLVAPYSLETSTKVDQVLNAYGIKGEKALKTMTALGDAVASVGGGDADFERVGLAIGQMSSSGHVMLQDINQLQNDGIPAIKILANQFGLSIADFRDQVSKGAIDSNTALQKLTDGIENGTDGINGATQKMGGLMEVQSHTLSGLLNNLGDAYKQFAYKVVQGKGFETIKKAISDLIDLLTSSALVKAIEPITTALGNLLDSALKKVEQLISKISELQNLSFFKKELLPLSQIFKNDEIKNVLLTTKNSLANSASATNQAWLSQNVTTALNSIVVTILNFARAIFDVNTTLMQNLRGGLGNTLNFLLKMIENFSNSLVKAVNSPAFQKVINLIVNLINIIIHTISSVISNFQAKFKGSDLLALLQPIFGVISQIVQLIGFLLNTLINLAGRRKNNVNIIAIFLNIVAETFTVAVHFVEQLINATLGIATNSASANKIGGVLRKIISIVISVFRQVFNFIADLISAIMGKNTNNAVANKTAAILKTVINTVISIFKEIFMFISDLIASIMGKKTDNSTANRIGQILRKVIGTTIFIFTEIFKFVSDLISAIFGKKTNDEIANRTAAVLKKVINTVIIIFTQIFTFIGDLVAALFGKKTDNTMANKTAAILKAVVTTTIAVFSQIFNFINQIIVVALSGKNGKNQWSNVIGQGLRGIVGLVIQVFSEIFNFVGRLINAVKNGSNTNRFSSILGNFIHKLIPLIFEGVQNLITMFAQLIKGVQKQDVFKNVAKTISAVKRLISSIFDAIISIITLLVNFWKALSKTGVYKSEGKFIGSLFNLINNIFRPIFDLMRIFVELIRIFCEMIEPIVKPVAKMLGSVFKNIFNVLSEIMDFFAGILNFSGKQISHFANQLSRIKGHNAHGTKNWRGGITEVGEKGTELVTLPNRQSFFTPNFATDMYLPAGTSILSNLDLTVPDSFANSVNSFASTALKTEASPNQTAISNKADNDLKSLLAQGIQNQNLIIDLLQKQSNDVFLDGEKMGTFVRKTVDDHQQHQFNNFSLI